MYQAARMEILTTSKGDRVETNLTDGQAADILERLSAGRTSTFAGSLAFQFSERGHWSDRQRPWAHKLALDADSPAPVRDVDTSAPKFPRLVEMLQRAANDLKFPRIVGLFDDGTLRINIAGERSRNCGSLNVTSNAQDYDNREFYGVINKDGGSFRASRDCPEWVAEALAAFNDDPAGTAALYGKRVGACCFCSRELSTQESRSVGYGPVCAGRYGLPWGEVSDDIRTQDDEVKEAYA